jgi:hypothetical protein
MSGIKIDLTKQTLKELLKKLKERRLDQDEAKQLISLLNIELDDANNRNDSYTASKIERMIFVLEGYITGFINLGDNSTNVYNRVSSY